jgi:hypothetical protein
MGFRAILCAWYSSTQECSLVLPKNPKKKKKKTKYGDIFGTCVEMRACEDLWRLKAMLKKCSCRTTEGAVGTTCRKTSLEALNKDGPDVPMSGDTW